MRKNKHLFLTIIFCSFAVGSASADEITQFRDLFARSEVPP